MNLTFLNKTDKALHAMRDDQTKDGGEARRVIKRRQLVGFSDGTLFMTAKATVETESRVGQVTIVGAR